MTTQPYGQHQLCFPFCKIWSPQPGGGIEDTSTDENDNKLINVIADENQELVLDRKLNQLGPN